MNEPTEWVEYGIVFSGRDGVSDLVRFKSTDPNDQAHIDIMEHMDWGDNVTPHRVKRVVTATAWEEI